MKVVDVVSVIVAGVLLLVLVQLSPATGASTRHHHRRHYRGYRQEMASLDAGSPSSNVPSVHNDATQWPSNCSHCSARQAKRDYRLASIKNEILRKLHLRSPPNITRRQLPDIPPLRDLIGDDMVSDSPSNDYSDDDYHATTMKIMLFPTPGMRNVLDFFASRVMTFVYRVRFKLRLFVATLERTKGWAVTDGACLTPATRSRSIRRRDNRKETVPHYLVATLCT